MRNVYQNVRELTGRASKNLQSNIRTFLETYNLTHSISSSLRRILNPFVYARWNEGGEVVYDTRNEKERGLIGELADAHLPHLAELRVAGRREARKIRSGMSLEVA